MLSSKFIVGSNSCDYVWVVEYNNKDNKYDWTVKSGGTGGIVGRRTLSSTKEEIEEWLNKTNHIKEYIELPDYFEFLSANGGKYYMSKLPNGDFLCGAFEKYETATYKKDGEGTLGVGWVKERFKEGDWEMLPTESQEVKPSANGNSANGVDAKGKPFHFTNDMFKPFMRVDAGGSDWIIYVDKNNQPYIVHTLEGYNPAYLMNEQDNTRKYYGIYAIYEPPEDARHALDPFKKGKLIWEYVEPVQQHTLPEEFYFKCSDGDIYKATASDGKYIVSWGYNDCHDDEIEVPYPKENVEYFVKEGIWIIQENPFKERLEQLGSQIKALQEEYDKLKVEVKIV